MPESILLRTVTSVACVLMLAHCGSDTPQTSCAVTNTCPAIKDSAGTPGSAAASGGSSAIAGTIASAAPTAGIGASAGAAASKGGAAGLSGGTGAAASGAGALANGGTGAAATAGSSAASGGSAAQAGASGMSVGGGAGNAGTSAAGSGAVVDHEGVPLAKLGDTKMGSREYLNLGDFRLLVNKWGSDELNCNTSMKVFANNDKSLGWSFDRGACGGNKQKPDYPEIEFGIHPFGAGSSLATTPSFSSTTVLPLQIKDIASASVTIDGLNANITRASTWNVDFEFWLSEKNPVTEANPGVYAELIAFWGWKDDWACDKTGSVTSGDKTYNLCHQDDNWGSGWRYYQFRASSASQTFSGKADVKAFLDYLVNTRGFSKDLWVTRIEIGSELDDNTAGMVSMKNITFQINANSKTAQFGQ